MKDNHPPAPPLRVLKPGEKIPAPLYLPPALRAQILQKVGLHEGWMLLTQAEFQSIAKSSDFAAQLCLRANDLRDASLALMDHGLVRTDADGEPLGEAHLDVLNDFKEQIALELPPRPKAPTPAPPPAQPS